MTPELAELTEQMKTAETLDFDLILRHQAAAADDLVRTHGISERSAMDAQRLAVQGLRQAFMRTGGTDPMTTSEVGAALGLSRYQVKEIEKTAIERAREILRQRGIRPGDL